MFFKTLLTSLALSAMVASPARARPCDTGCDSKPESRLPSSVVRRFFNVWNGDEAAFNQTFTPDIEVLQDRYPSSNGSTVFVIENAAEYLNFMQGSRNGFESYQFDTLQVTGDVENAIVRWQLNGIAGPDFAKSHPGSTLQAGDTVAYRGTDWLHVNPCGLIEQVESAQDYITYFHNLGASTINV